jgi:transcriptional regulator with XRE-family HTH domain
MRQSKGLKQKDLADAIDKESASISRWESGKALPDLANLVLLASALGTEIPTLLAAGGYLEEGITLVGPTEGLIPLFGFGSAGEGLMVGDEGYPYGEGEQKIERSSSNRDPHSYATRVKGISMVPALLDGDVVEVVTNVEVQSGAYAVVIHQDGRKWIKKVHYRAKKRILALESLNGAEGIQEFSVDDIRAVHKVVAIKRRGMY